MTVSRVVYQIYPRSFLDTTGSGVGDLDGVTARLDHLVWLGVDAIWLSPINPSPGVDGGYDVADHRDVDACFGGLPAFDRLLAAAHERGIRVLLDWVPNHTSDQHPWFVSSREDPSGPHGDWYWWSDEPNNWPSAFGGKAWTFDPVRGQYYLHLFTPAQPDLNWNTPGVRAAMLDGLRFWLDRGVDGFRADVVNLIGRDPALPDHVPTDPGNLNDFVGNYRDPRTHDLLREIRAVLSAYPGDRVMIGEVPLAHMAVPSYVDDQQLHAAFDFSLMEAPWSAPVWRTLIAEAEGAYGSRGAPAWVLSSHDQPRHRTRHGDREDRVRVAATVLLTLRGTPFVYAGEELGLSDAVIPPEHRRDPLGRDGSRAPVPWTAAPGHGWATDDPWLPWPPEPDTRNAETLRANESSILWLYRRLIALRGEHSALRDGELSMLDGPPDVLAYRRGADLLVLANFSDREVRVPWQGRVLLTSGPARFVDGVLAPCTAVVLARPPGLP